MTNIENSNWEQLNTLEWRLKESFKNFNLNENQIKRLIKCIEKKVNKDEENDNKELKEKIIIKKYKKIL